MTVVFDTNIHIAYKLPRLPRGALLSTVVLHELAAGAPDQSTFQYWETVKTIADKETRLLTLTTEDWWLAAKVLYSLCQGLKSRAKGVTPALPIEEVQRIIRDTLIARTTRRAGATLITDNIKDFELIKRFCAVRVMRGSDYFG